MNKVIFLDRDGTINVDYGYVHEKEKLEFVPGVIEALKIISELGYKLIIVTNQSGIGRGYFSAEEYENFTNYMLEKMKQGGADVEKVYTCPHIDKDNCDCRKPKLGLFEQAIKDYDVDLVNSFSVGDRLRDLEICGKYPIKAVLYEPDLEVVNRDDKKSNATANFDVKMLKTWSEIANYIKECTKV